MRLLLDTHALLWWLDDDYRLSQQARAAIADPRNTVSVSPASAWEISIKCRLGKLEAPEDLEEQIEANGFVPLPITIADGIAAGRLPRHHDDPFDRMLVAQAQAHGLTIISRDPRLAAYEVDIIRT